MVIGRTRSLQDGTSAPGAREVPIAKEAIGILGTASVTMSRRVDGFGTASMAVSQEL